MEDTRFNGTCVRMWYARTHNSIDANLYEVFIFHFNISNSCPDLIYTWHKTWILRIANENKKKKQFTVR